MGSGRWFRCLKGAKEDKTNRGKVHSERSNGTKPRESTAPFTALIGSSSARTGMPIEEVAAVIIQKAIRAFMARKRIYRLKSADRFNSLIRGHTIKNQTSVALSVMHSWCDIQSQIRARRLYMVTEGRLQQKRLENRLKLEAKLQELEVEWCGGSETMDEILARIQQREEAAVKRERAMAYAFSHQWRANATHYLGQASFGLGKENWGWSWKERWISARPWEVRVQSQDIKPKKCLTKPTSKPDKITTPKQVSANGKEAADLKKGVSSSFG
ncbi:PREDICTED: protein IQ-DOMAIN 1 [Tarenaya hassleriana]|uniref:protein IQ-DOMAIN 1 n=1 Tax=Tarenaya hassleriana TaxID=28532 RepID=UPI00053C612F|nr:PREDICTED: protein IQ-DOMAIN 1 [Tarenaya hassleriana]XP_010519242.1 PREDICTED: protein IQ-DOMAIN 1 [Tarenaya hassleriana]